MSEPSPKSIGSILRSEPQANSRASERTDAPVGARIEVRDERARLEARVRELRLELAKLPDTVKARHMEAKRRQKLAAILANVEKRLKSIRQMRLF